MILLADSKSRMRKNDETVQILQSYRQMTGRDLLPGSGSPDQLAHRLYHAPFVVLAHDVSADPLFTYANLAAQRLFEFPRDELVGMPSRLSAEPVLREDRQKLLERVARDGYMDDYHGVRIAKSGQRFMIKNATVWNLIDSQGLRLGQAATFATVEYLSTC